MDDMRPSIRTFFAVAWHLALLTACQGPEARGEPFLMTDSSGVTIVESRRPLWESGERWTLSPEPEVVIGVAEGDERYLLSGVVGVRRLPDGRIAILDGGSRRVRVYDSAGRHRMDLGGDGDGPSEFRSPQFLGRISDTLFVYEVLGGRVKLFSPDGDLVRTFDFLGAGDGEMASLHGFGLLEDRFLIGVGDNRSYVEGLNRVLWPIWSLDLLDVRADSLFSVPGGEVMIAFLPAGVTRHRRHVFGKYTQFAVSADRVYVAPTDAFSIRVFDRERNLRQIIRRPDAPRPVTASDFDQWIEEELDRRGTPPEDRAESRRSAQELTFAETMPAFRSIAVDSEGYLWVEEWEGVGLDQGGFAVFRPDGAWLGNVALPEGLPEGRGGHYEQWIEIRSDYVLGVWTDEYDVEQVRLYRIERN